MTPVALFLAWKNRELLAEVVGVTKRQLPQITSRPLANGSMGVTP